jgi:hypothetical protein
LKDNGLCEAIRGGEVEPRAGASLPS